MKIIEVIPQLSSGGAERFVVDLCNQLANHSEVVLITYYQAEGANFYLPDLASSVKHIALNKEVGLSISMFGKIFSIIKLERPDVVHMHLLAINYLLPCILFNHKRIKYFMTIHSDAEKEAGGKLGAFIRWLCFRLKLVTPITISEESRRSFVEYYGIDAPVIFNGRSIPKFLHAPVEIVNEVNSYKRDKNTRVIVNLARLNPVKRQPLLAKVSKRLYDERYDFSVLYIGNIRDEHVYEEMKQNSSPNQYILGEKTNPLDYLAVADAFCLCSSYEGLPISLIEALGMGVVPICTPVGGIVNIIQDRKNGLLTKDLSEESLYETLKHYLSLPLNEVERLRICAKQSYEPYSMGTCAGKYEKLFNSNEK